MKMLSYMSKWFPIPALMPCVLAALCLWVSPVSAQPKDQTKKSETAQSSAPKTPNAAPSKPEKTNAQTNKSSEKKETLPTYGTILVEVPDGYRVTVDGTYVGESPLTGPWAVSVGRHTVNFSKDGQPDGEIEVEVIAGQRARAVWPPKTVTIDDGDSDEGGWIFPEWTKADAGFAAAIAGLVVVGVGVSFGMRSQALADEAAEMNIRDTYRADFVRLTGQAEDASLAANLSYGIGAAALIGGLTVAIFGEGGLITVIGDDDEGAVIIEGEF